MLSDKGDARMKIMLDVGAYTPTRAHDTDAGLDLYAREDKLIPAGGSAVFDTGVHVELPSYERATRIDIDGRTGGIIGVHYGEMCTTGFLKSKSGLNVKHGITSEGVIDMGYTGAIVVKLYNHGTEDYQVHAGDKISQLVIAPVLTPTLEVVDALEDTERGENGFGSTGK